MDPNRDRYIVFSPESDFDAIHGFYPTEDSARRAAATYTTQDKHRTWVAAHVTILEPAPHGRT